MKFKKNLRIIVMIVFLQILLFGFNFLIDCKYLDNGCGIQVKILNNYSTMKTACLKNG